MILSLDQMDGETRTMRADEVFTFDDVTGSENRLHCATELRVRRVGETYYVSASLSGSFSTACHKCLEQTQQRVTSAFELVIQRGDSRAPAGEVDGGDDSLLLIPRGESRISLDQRVYESLIVNIPIRILCREDCKGLCPSCGANLNLSRCRCAAPTDARWDGLSKLGGSAPE